MIAFFMLACSSGSSGFSFGGGGERYDINVPDSGDTAGDTNDSSGGDTSGEPGAPVIKTFVLSWADYPNVGIVLYADIEYSDDPDDVVGGKLFFTLTEDVTLTVVEEGDDNTDDAAYRVSDAAEVYFAIADLDDSKGYTMEDVFFRDKAGHESAHASAEIDPNDDGGK